MQCMLTADHVAYSFIVGHIHTKYVYCFHFSGPCMTLLLSKASNTPDTGDGTIEYFRDLIGPKDVNIAKEEAPAR